MTPYRSPPTSATHARARPMFDNRVLGLFEAFIIYFDHPRLAQRQPKPLSQEMPPLVWEMTFWPKVVRASPGRSSDDEAECLYGPSQLRRHLRQRGPIISFPLAGGDDLSGRTSKARPLRAAPTTPTHCNSQHTLVSYPYFDTLCLYIPRAEKCPVLPFYLLHRQQLLIRHLRLHPHPAGPQPLRVSSSRPPWFILPSLLIVSHSHVKWTSKTLRRSVSGRHQRTSDTASTACKPRRFRYFSHSFCQGSDLPRSVMRKRWRPQGRPQCLHKGCKSHPGFHGYCGIQSRECSGKARCAMEGAHRLPAGKWRSTYSFLYLSHPI
jgi:hypothetical protein